MARSNRKTTVKRQKYLKHDNLRMSLSPMWFYQVQPDLELNLLAGDESDDLDPFIYHLPFLFGETEMIYLMCQKLV